MCIKDGRYSVKVYWTTCCVTMFSAPSLKAIYHNILANLVTENLKIVLGSLREGKHFKPEEILGNESW